MVRYIMSSRIDTQILKKTIKLIFAASVLTTHQSGYCVQVERNVYPRTADKNQSKCVGPAQNGHDNHLIKM
jgi:hypothetical protein